MKKFDSSLWVRSADSADTVVSSLEHGWPQRWHGQPQAEMVAAGYGCPDEWCVDDKGLLLRNEFVDEVAKAFCQHKYQNLPQVLYSVWTSPKWCEKVEKTEASGCEASYIGFDNDSCNCAYLRCGECFLTDTKLLGEIQASIQELRQKDEVRC